MNWLLICVIGILVVCALEGYFRGFIKIVFSLFAMIITLAVVSVAAPKITTYIEENTELDERITEKCLEHVEKNAQDRLNREAQEKSEETRQQLEENGVSGSELDAIMDKAAEAGSDAVHQALADSGVYQAMAQFMIINLDEFNQIWPQVQQGFLKNLIQLPTLKYKPPYGSHVMEFPRLASFIATSNMKDILSDPSGNRRFIGVELTGPIDVSVRPNYQQLFAQALSALNNGEKSYFDAQQVKLIMKSNSQFEIIQPIDQYFLLYFELVEDEKEGEYLTAAEIFDYLKKQIGSSLKVNSLMGFGRKLANMSELKHKRFADGMKYLVKKK